MATVDGRVAEAKRQVIADAAARWAQRAEQRKSALAMVAAMGPGAADSPLQQMQWASRQANKAAAGVPRFAERVIGTRDFIPFAPSSQAASAATPVARITTIPDGGYAAQGIATGLLLPGSLLLTNYHVFPGAAYASGHAANFRYAQDEHGISEGVYFEIDPAIFWVENSVFDFVLVAVKPKGLKNEDLSALGSTRLIEATGKILTGMPIDIIQHPDGGPRQFAVSNNRLVDLLPEGYLHYETDTDRGSSGSPVFNPDWELIGLHHCGVPEMKDGKVMTVRGTVWDEAHEPESEIHWIANEGTRVSRIVDQLRSVKLGEPAKQQALDRLLTMTADPFESAGNALATTIVSSDARGNAMATNLFSFSGPVTIHVYAPQPSVVPVPAPPPAVAPIVESFEESALLFDEQYEKRTGYDTDFLGVHVPLPEVTSARTLEMYSVKDYVDYYNTYRNIPKVEVDAWNSDDAMPLQYHHYSLATNKKYCMCMWTASNCDYRDSARQDKRKRSALGSESWRYDPRVPSEYQLGNADVYGPAKRVDRGHIVRREDNCWGDIGLQTDYANSDTYHWTNCTPQHEAFNQENPSDKSPKNVYGGTGQKGLWGQFESSVATQIEHGGGQAVLFAGPVLADFFAAIDFGTGQVHIPKRFWKVVVVPETPARKPKLLAYGYIFSQVSVVQKFGLTYEALELPRFDRRRIKLSDLSDLTGVVFPKEVLDVEQPMPVL